MNTDTFPSLLINKLIRDDHKLRPRAQILKSLIWGISTQGLTRGGVAERLEARLDLIRDSPPSTAMDARRTRLRRRIQGAWWRVDELHHRMVVLEVAALDLLVEAGYALENPAHRGNYSTPEGRRITLM